MLTKLFLFIIIFQVPIFSSNLESDENVSANDTLVDIPPTVYDVWNDYNCKFEVNSCKWIKDKFSDATWESTPPISSIPAPPQGKQFLRLKYGRKNKWGDFGQIFSPVFPVKVRWLRVDFWFYISSPGLYTYTGLKLGQVNERRVITWLFGSAAITQGWDPKWIHVSLCIPKMQPNTRLAFFGQAEKGHEVAIDDVVVTDKVEPCNNLTLLSPKMLPQPSSESQRVCPNHAVAKDNKDVLFVFVLIFFYTFNFVN